MAIPSDPLCLLHAQNVHLCLQDVYEIFVDSATTKMDNGIMHLASAWIITDTLLPATATQSLSWMDD